MNLMAWPEPDLNPPDLPPPQDQADSVYEVLQHPYAWDADNHDGQWWATELRHRDFFNNLDDHDRAVLLAGLTRLPELFWCKGLQQKLRAEIKDILEE